MENKSLDNIFTRAFPGARTGSSKQGAKSRKKGVDNEKVLAKKLTEWVGVKFMRTPGSGSLGRQAMFMRMDIMITEGKFPFGIETKRYKAITGGKLLKVWEKAKSEHELPLIFLKLDGMRFWWVYSDKDLGMTIHHEIGILKAYSSIELFKISYDDFRTFCTVCFGISFD